MLRRPVDELRVSGRRRRQPPHIARQDSEGKSRVVSHAGLALPLVAPDHRSAIVLGIPNGVPLEAEHDDESVSIELGSEPGREPTS